MSSEKKYLNSSYQDFFEKSLSKTDPDLFKAINDELVRQQNHIELIASENIVSKDGKGAASADVHVHFNLNPSVHEDAYQNKGAVGQEYLEKGTPGQEHMNINQDELTLA